MAEKPIWIDFANSPHVLFFRPVIAELERRGIRTTVSIRDFAQTVGLCRLLGIEATVVGKHGGAHLYGKARNLVERVRSLRAFAKKVGPALALSHNSYAQAVAGRTLGIPVATAMDYEFQPANHLAFRCADLVVVPDTFPLDTLHQQGARPSKVWRYHGLKEEIALAGFTPDSQYLRRTGIDDSRVVVVVRPPADMSLYHRFENPLFLLLLERLKQDDSLSVVLLPRTEEQRHSLERAGFTKLIWQGATLDGPQLIAGADAVISAGGSMNREAAVLGTPAYSIYAGRLAGIDRALVAQGKLVLLRSPDDITHLRLGKKSGESTRPVGAELLQHFVDKILEVAQR